MATKRDRVLDRVSEKVLRMFSDSMYNVVEEAVKELYPHLDDLTENQFRKLWGGTFNEILDRAIFRFKEEVRSKDPRD